MNFSGNGDSVGTVNHRVLGWDYIGAELKNLPLYYCFIIWDNKDMAHLERTLSVPGASGHDPKDNSSRASSHANVYSSRKTSEGLLLKNQSVLADHQSNYFKSKVTNENRESLSKDTAVRMNSMQTNLAFMDELIKK